MIYGYARIPTDGRSVAARVAALRKDGAGAVFREVASEEGWANITLHRRRAWFETRPDFAGTLLTMS